MEVCLVGKMSPAKKRFKPNQKTKLLPVNGFVHFAEIPWNI
uniref:Uncharacterized protein n=1 Tax=Arundo donax TaxID=35708 RepID=A0A0A9FKU7_ARUDO